MPKTWQRLANGTDPDQATPLDASNKVNDFNNRNILLTVHYHKLLKPLLGFIAELTSK